jgi:hypothetical protein
VCATAAGTAGRLFEVDARRGSRGRAADLP